MHQNKASAKKQRNEENKQNQRAKAPSSGKKTAQQRNLAYEQLDEEPSELHEEQAKLKKQVQKRRQEFSSIEFAEQPATNMKQPESAKKQDKPVVAEKKA